ISRTKGQNASAATSVNGPQAPNRAPAAPPARTVAQARAPVSARIERAILIAILLMFCSVAVFGKDNRSRRRKTKARQPPRSSQALVGLSITNHKSQITNQHSSVARPPRAPPAVGMAVVLAGPPRSARKLVVPLVLSGGDRRELHLLLQLLLREGLLAGELD